MRALAIVALFAACNNSRPSIATPTDGASPDTPADAAPDAAPGFVDPFPPLQALPAVCSPDGWCWNVPTPSGTFYTHLESSADDNIWLVGGGPMHAAIMQWDGHTWTTHEPPIGPCQPGACPPSLFPETVQTTASNNTWLAYDGNVEHWDGAQWTIVNAGDTGFMLQGLWANATGGAWTTDASGRVIHYHDGTRDTFVHGGGAIWGTGDDDIFLSGIDALDHYDGTQFSPLYRGARTVASYQGVRNDVWIAGADAALLHWDGTTVVDHSAELVAAGVNPRGIVFSAEYHAADDVTWLANSDSAAPDRVIHWDGTQITTRQVIVPNTPLGDSLCGQLGDTKILHDRWWVVCNDGAVATMDRGGSLLEPVISPWTVTGPFWGASASDLYTVGGQVRHFDGTSWSLLAAPPLETIVGRAGAGIGGADELFGTHAAFEAGDYHIYLDHFDGAAWAPQVPLTEYPLGGPLLNIATVAPLGPDEAIVVGGAGTILHYQAGATTTIQSPTTNDLFGAFALDSDHVLIAGHGGAVLDWDRASPKVATVDPAFPSTTDDLNAVASAGGVEWIVTENQLHVWMKPAGGAWQSVPTPFSPIGPRIAAINATNVVLVATDTGEVARWNGTSFVMEYYPNEGLNSHIFALPDGTTYLGGLSGIIVHP